MDVNEKWEKFIHDNLLKDGFIDGLLLFSPDLERVYQYGKLVTVIDKSECLEFKEIFESVHHEPQRLRILANGLTLKLQEQLGGVIDTKLVIRHLQSNCLCGVTKGNELGIVVVKFAFGFLVASHSYPISSHVALHKVQDTVVLLST